MLEKSRNELELLRTELEPLRNTSTALRNAASQSEQELTALKTALRKAETSLMNLEISYSAYRTATESQLARTNKTNRVFRYVALTLGAAALAGWTAFAVTASR
jgi:predicted  nucleic acid-binding Zn-ribbon protein